MIYNSPGKIRGSEHNSGAGDWGVRRGLKCRGQNKQDEGGVKTYRLPTLGNG